MAFILGKKLNMTQVWKNNTRIPVTVIEAGPVTVTQVRNKEKDGYQAVQIGFDPTKKKIGKAMQGHLKDMGNFRFLKEFRSENSDIKTGDIFNVAQFSEGDTVKISGLSKGRGFQGPVKRHGFHGGPKTHGQKNRYRAPGSIGATAPQRVTPGKKMAGRMGQERVTIKTAKVIAIDAENNLIMIKGAVPGMKGSLVEIKK